MRRSVELSKSAQEDLQRLEEYLSLQSSTKAVARFRNEFLKAMDLLSDELSGFPYVEGKDPLRKMTHWKYLYFHLELTDRVIIVRIFSEKENWINELELND
ncbi:type II toxin-antitoxin system RelE/ParE family toxin [Lactococcus insecticola]|uniref:Type II toxin-antitoxin system RelE/ParE family toxin n=1 Tax=Pseudolactococcus insecticola TaxID=2709158 RepID=A0A6A0B7S4_9LACT|nr:type II toxin-antitoxin system RelE/ParE family toxin [Lactococcus insecticola]GFH40835.1 hypothetical protein Hs20B_12330 [Lactococcus insecticola]